MLINRRADKLCNIRTMESLLLAIKNKWFVTAVPNLFGSRDQFCVGQFFSQTEQGWGMVSG